jgi:hypothetical protein
MLKVNETNGIKYMEAYESPMKEKNENEHGHGGCFCCAKPIVDEDANNKWVHYTTGGYIINTRDEQFAGEELGETQGFFPVGPACAKKMPKEFIFSSTPIEEKSQEPELKEFTVLEYTRFNNLAGVQKTVRVKQFDNQVQGVHWMKQNLKDLLTDAEYSFKQIWKIQ